MWCGRPCFQMIKRDGDPAASGAKLRLPTLSCPPVEMDVSCVSRACGSCSSQQRHSVCLGSFRDARRSHMRSQLNGLLWRGGERP